MWSAEFRSEFHRHSEIVLGRHDVGVVVDVGAVSQGDEAGFPNAAVLEIEQVFTPARVRTCWPQIFWPRIA